MNNDLFNLYNSIRKEFGKTREHGDVKAQDSFTSEVKKGPLKGTLAISYSYHEHGVNVGDDEPIYEVSIWDRGRLEYIFRLQYRGLKHFAEIKYVSGRERVFKKIMDAIKKSGIKSKKYFPFLD